MRLLLATVLAVSTMASGCSATAGKPDDGAPSPIAIEHPIERNQPLSEKQLAELGITVSVADGGDEYGLYVTLREDLRQAIADDRAGLHFSIWSREGSLVLGMPQVNVEDGPFLVADGYRLRVMLDSKSGYAGLELGVGYFALFDRSGYLSKE